MFNLTLKECPRCFQVAAVKQLEERVKLLRQAVESGQRQLSTGNLTSHHGDRTRYTLWEQNSLSVHTMGTELPIPVYTMGTELATHHWNRIRYTPSDHADRTPYTMYTPSRQKSLHTMGTELITLWEQNSIYTMGMELYTPWGQNSLHTTCTIGDRAGPTLKACLGSRNLAHAASFVFAQRKSCFVEELS